MKTPGDFSSPIWRYAGIGFELVAAIGLFIFIGWWVDGRFGTEPWGILVGAFIGVVGGMYNLIREALEAARSSGDGGKAAPIDKPGRDEPGYGAGADTVSSGAGPSAAGEAGTTPTGPPPGHESDHETGRSDGGEKR